MMSCKIVKYTMDFWCDFGRHLSQHQASSMSDTLPNSSHLKIGHPKRKQSYSNHPFSGAKMLVSGRVFPGNNMKFNIINCIGDHLRPRGDSPGGRKSKPH